MAKEGKVVYHKERAASATAKKNAEQAATAPAPMEVEGDETAAAAGAGTAGATAGGSKDVAKERHTAGEEPAAKRASIDEAPAGLTVRVNKADGNCLFEAWGQALGATKDRPKVPRGMRATCITHMRKYLERYRKLWGGLAPCKDQETPR